MNERKLLNFDNIILLVISLAMLNNVEHLAYVHHSIARLSFPFEWMNKAHSIVVVLIIEIIIITLAHYGQRGFAGFYTFLLYCLQLIYYPLNNYIHQGEWGKFFAAIIYSGMFTLSIYYFSVMKANRDEEKRLDEALRRKNDTNKPDDELNRIKREAEANRIESTEKLNESNRIIEELKANQIESTKKLNESNRIIAQLQSKQNESTEKLNESNRIASEFLKSHILYEAWMSKKRSEQNRNGYDAAVTAMADKIKQGNKVTIDDYIKAIKHEAEIQPV